MSFITQAGANALLGWAFTENTMWVGLGSGSSSGLVSGQPFPELSGSGYSRQQITGWSITSGVGYPSSGITFGPATSGWGIQSIGVWTGPTNSSPIWWAGDLVVSAGLNPGDFASFTSGALAIGFINSGQVSGSLTLQGDVLILGNLTVDGNIQQN